MSFEKKNTFTHGAPGSQFMCAPYNIERFHGVDEIVESDQCWNLEHSMGARNQVGRGLSYRAVRLHRLAESIPGLLKSLIRALYRLFKFPSCGIGQCRHSLSSP